eukprot:1715227-Pleurochrysis_carterae.AAC.1
MRATNQACEPPAGGKNCVLHKNVHRANLGHRAHQARATQTGRRYAARGEVVFAMFSGQQVQRFFSEAEPVTS